MSVKEPWRNGGKNRFAPELCLYQPNKKHHIRYKNICYGKLSTFNVLNAWHDFLTGYVFQPESLSNQIKLAHIRCALVEFFLKRERLIRSWAVNNIHTVSQSLLFIPSTAFLWLSSSYRDIWNRKHLGEHSPELKEKRRWNVIEILKSMTWTRMRLKIIPPYTALSFRMLRIVMSFLVTSRGERRVCEDISLTPVTTHRKMYI